MGVSSPSRLPGCVLLSRGQGSKTMGVSKASGGLVSPPQSVGQTRFKAHPDSGGEKNELHLFLFFSFFLVQNWNLLREILRLSHKSPVSVEQLLLNLS